MTIESVGTRTKDLDEVLDYSMDWSLWLENGDTIDSAECTLVTPPNGSLTIPRTDTYDDRIVFWVAGGTSGSTYNILVKITTRSSPARVGEVMAAIKIR